MPRGRKKKDKQKPRLIDPDEAPAALRKFVEVDDEPASPDPQEGKGKEELQKEADEFIRRVAYGDGPIR